MKSIFTGQIGVVAHYVVVWTVACAAVPQSRANAHEVDSIRHRYLLLDSRIMAGAKNAQLVVGTVRKHQANPLFGEDKPWEKRFDNLYGNVIYDTEEKMYKCWYSPFIVDHSAGEMDLYAWPYSVRMVSRDMSRYRKRRRLS